MNDELKAESSANTVSDRAPTAAEIAGHRLVLISIAATLFTFCIAAFYPSRQTIDESLSLSFGAAYAWVAAQSFLLTVPGILIGFAIGVVFPRIGSLIGAAVIFTVPVIVFCDVLTFAWIGERFLSETMHRITTTLLPALTLHITRSTVVDAVMAVAVAMIAMLVCWVLAGFIGRLWIRSRDPVRPLTATVVFCGVAMLVSAPAIWNYTRTVSEMENHSVQHPFCAFHLVGYRGVGVTVPTGEKATLARLRGLQSAPMVQKIDERQLALELDKEEFRKTADQRNLQDVIIIVAESLRPEVVDPEVMPNLYEFAQRSMYCKQHFSEGNSTCYGVFGLLNGLEAIWFDRPIWERPILNKVLHQAGYELGFFGGEDDWTDFGMDGYVRGAHFDYFEIEYPELLDSDYRSVQRTLDFVEEGKRLAKEQPDFRMPRLGITYLLNTHCRYISEEEDQIFQPAAPENFVLPYSSAMVEQIYNRYKNSARTLDRMIKPLLRDDCIVIVIGDHGESFLEDGSAIHGLRLSKVQNMTPMILYYPGVEPQSIEHPTYHADILPTLLSILDVPVSDPNAFDGRDLTTIDAKTLAERVLITSNFMDRTIGLIGPWTTDPNRPFAYRFLYNIGDWQIGYLNPIDEQGYECPDVKSADAPRGEQLYRDWITNRIGAEALREDLSEKELFTRSFRSEDRETRMSAIRIAKDIGSPEPYLYDLIAEAARDEDPEIRSLAKEMVIRTVRSSTRN